jgi:predicted TIM-barrel fold metal-dependent hydrolase
MDGRTEIVDVCAWIGTWPALRLGGEDVDHVVGRLQETGVGTILMTHLEGAFAHNPHLPNIDVYQASRRHASLLPVPLLDPSLATWREELAAALEWQAPGVRLLPAYGGYDLGECDELAAAIGEAGLALFVQTRLEDPRRQHPRAVVSDVAATDVAALARRHPQVSVVIGGAAWTPILNLAPEILAVDNLYADVSQADGMDSLLRMVEVGLEERLLFGTHAPFFIPLAGLARVVIDLPEDSAAAILGGNARRLLRLSN